MCINETRVQVNPVKQIVMNFLSCFIKKILTSIRWCVPTNVMYENARFEKWSLLKCCHFRHY